MSNFTSVFDYRDYKKYLVKLLDNPPSSKRRGFKSEFAKAISCQQSYLSRILSSQADLSPEQANSASIFLNHTKLERKYFFLLTLFNKSGTKSLSDTLEKELDELKASSLMLNTRTELKQYLTVADQVEYYSTWQYAAIHMAICLEQYSVLDEISKRFLIPKIKVRKIVNFLLNTGLIKKNKEKYEIGPSQIHLSHDSELILRHHVNWRIESIKNLDKSTLNDLHYSSIASISKKDIPKVREILVKAIEEVRSIIKISNDDSVICYQMDLFQLDKA